MVWLRVGSTLFCVDFNMHHGGAGYSAAPALYVGPGFSGRVRAKIDKMSGLIWAWHIYFLIVLAG